jgi:hypothetical protein
MSSLSPRDTAGTLVPNTAASSADSATGAIQRLVDQVAGFNVYVIPRPPLSLGRGGDSTKADASRIALTADLVRFEVGLQRPSQRSGVQATNRVGELVGRLDLCWVVIPDGVFARPDRPPSGTPLDSSQSQRFVMQEMTFQFGSGSDGFRSFGTGRTFPLMVGSETRLMVSAIGNVTEGTGKFRGHEGNFTVCGDLDERGFRGHIVLRIIDSDRTLRTDTPLLDIADSSDPDPATTILMWGAQKGAGPDLENRPSFTPDGTLRGLNIPTELKFLQLGFAYDERQGFRATDLRVGDAMGREVGFGRGSVPGATEAGTADSPFLFEGVAKYSFHDQKGCTVGAITTNVVEGRRFDVSMPGVPGGVGWRFGFFGPIVCGYGCFVGASGMFYGASGSFFQPPPGLHVITHFYFARLSDPNGKFRASVNQFR